MAESGKTRWPLYLLGGCLIIVIVGVAAFVGVIYWGKNRLTTMVEEQTNPKTRDRRAKEILGATTLPPGYYAGVSLSMGLARIVRLTDVPPDSTHATTYDERAFVYNESIHAEPSEITEYLDGKRGNVFDEMGTRLRTDEVLSNGELTVDGQRIRYSVRRGELTQDDEAMAGVFAVVFIPCGDDRERWGVWFHKGDAAPPDEPAMTEFFRHFNVCRKR